MRFRDALLFELNYQLIILQLFIKSGQGDQQSIYAQGSNQQPPGVSQPGWGQPSESQWNSGKLSHVTCNSYFN